MDRCRAVYYSGTVQGVGFRFAARGLAQRYAVTGFVTNLTDGRVQMVISGEEKELSNYLSALRARMGDYIAEEKGEWIPEPERFETFDIRF